MDDFSPGCFERKRSNLIDGEEIVSMNLKNNNWNLRELICVDADEHDEWAWWRLNARIEMEMNEYQFDPPSGGLFEALFHSLLIFFGSDLFDSDQFIKGLSEFLSGSIDDDLTRFEEISPVDFPLIRREWFFLETLIEVEHLLSPSSLRQCSESVRRRWSSSRNVAERRTRLTSNDFGRPLLRQLTCPYGFWQAKILNGWRWPSSSTKAWWLNWGRSMSISPQCSKRAFRPSNTDGLPQFHPSRMIQWLFFIAVNNGPSCYSNCLVRPPVAVTVTSGRSDPHPHPHVRLFRSIDSNGRITS